MQAAPANLNPDQAASGMSRSRTRWHRNPVKQPPTEWMLDTNEFHHLLDDSLAGGMARVLGLRGRVVLTTTHVQLDQLSGGPEPQRTRLLALVRWLGVEAVPSEVFVLGSDPPLPKRVFGGSRLGGAKLSDEGAHLLNLLISEDPGSVSDAVIGVTSIIRRAVLVTNDRRLRRRILRVDPEAVVWGHEAFKRSLVALHRRYVFSR